MLNVRSSLGQVGPKWIEGKPKTDSGERRVDLGERTVGLLLMVQLAQDEDRKRWGTAYQENGRVFARGDGSDLSPESVTKTFRRLATSTGLRPMRLHDLRHVAASLMISSGADIAVASDSDTPPSASLRICTDTCSRPPAKPLRMLPKRSFRSIPRCRNDQSAHNAPTGLQVAEAGEERARPPRSVSAAQGPVVCLNTERARRDSNPQPSDP